MPPPGQLPGTGSASLTIDKVQGLRYHTVVSNRSDPTGEYIENLDQSIKNQDRGPDLDLLASQPFQILDKKGCPRQFAGVGYE